MDLLVKWHINQNSTRNKFVKKNPWARFWCNFPRSSACAFDRSDATVEWIPMKFLRCFGLSLNQMGPKVDLAPGAIRMMLCCNQTREVLQKSQKVVPKSSKGLCGQAKIGGDIHSSVSFRPNLRSWPIFEHLKTVKPTLAKWWLMCKMFINTRKS